VKSKKIMKPDLQSNSIWVLILGATATSLCIDRQAFDPFNTAKLICILLISGWIAGHLLNSYRENPIQKNSKELLTLIILLLFLLTLCISVALTDVKVTALFGDTFRRNGFLQYFALSILFLYASRSINYLYSIRFYKIAIFTGFIMSGYGLIQISGNDFFAWNNPYNSMISTVGNPNFASSLLAIFFLLGGSTIFIKQISSSYKLFAILMMIMSFIAIVLSQSRQGLITIAIGILFYVSLVTFLKNRRYSVPVVSASLFILLFGIMGMLQKGPLSSILYKESVSIRGYYWQAGFEMLKKNPLTGVGLDRYGANFKEFRNVSYPLEYGFNITSSNAHNTFIQLFATGGIFVGLSYLFLLGYVFISGLKSLKKSDPNQQKILLGLLSAWIGFQAQSLISIDNIGLSVWGWLLSGSILGVTSNVKILEDPLRQKNKNQNVNKKSQINLFQPIMSGLFLIPIVLICYFLLQSERDLAVARNYNNPSAPQNKQTVLNFANQVINNPLADKYYKLQVSLYLYDMGYSEYAYNIIKKLSNADKRNLDNLNALLAIEIARDNKMNSVKIREEIAKYDPWNAQNYLELGKLYKFSGDSERARLMKDKILSFAPNTNEAKNAIQVLA
jgi:O-antigen ligase